MVLITRRPLPTVLELLRIHQHHCNPLPYCTAVYTYACGCRIGTARKDVNASNAIISYYCWVMTSVIDITDEANPRGVQLIWINANSGIRWKFNTDNKMMACWGALISRSFMWCIWLSNKWILFLGQDWLWILVYPCQADSCDAHSGLIFFLRF